MKPTTLMRFSGMILFATIAIPAQLAAQQIRYKPIILKTFGGPQSFVANNGNTDVKGAYLRVITNYGTVTGTAETSTPDPNPGFCVTSDCFVAHAFRWRNGVMTDLGALPHNLSGSGTMISTNGLIAGVSENPFDIDPVLGFPVFRGTLWKGITTTYVGALTNEGGHTSPATGVNSRGQAIGFAFTSMPDNDSMLGVGFQARAYVSHDGVIRDLGTLGGPDAEALLINNKGQVVGDSYVNFNRTNACGRDLPLTTGAFIWQQGKMEGLGSFGGTCTIAIALNNRGQVTGASNLTGDQAFHPYLWEQGSMKDLGTFGGNFGQGASLNEAGEVVGFAYYPGDQVFRAALWKNGHIRDIGTLPVSFDAQFTTARAFLWEDGRPMLDLDSLIASSGLQFQVGPQATGIANINDRGEIVGNATDTSGHLHAVVLVPCSEGDTACNDPESAAAQVALRENTNHTAAAQQIRSMLLRRGILRTDAALK